jgi:hypothetical protein
VRTDFLLAATATATALTILAARPASANGRFPASNQIVFSPTNENLIIGRATWAILPSADNGKTWGYLCEDALSLPDVGNYEDPELGLTANNALVAGLSLPTVGLDVSPDLGCNWDCIGGPLDNQSVADIVVRPDTPHQVLAVTSTSGTTVDAGNASQVYESVDDGTTWNPLGTPIDPTVTVQTIDVSATDPNQIYLSGTRGYGTGLTASLFISSNKGMTWVEHAVPGFNPPTPCADTPTVMCPTEQGIFIGAVDPTDPTRVYLRSQGVAGSLTPSNSRLYVTTDGGQTFTVPKSFVLPSTTVTNPNSDYAVSGEMLGFALSPDGSTVYIGTAETGLWTATKAALDFTQTNSKIAVQCLATRQTSAGVELWACSNELSGFVFGKSLNGGKSFTPMMASVTSSSGLIACSGTGTTSNACFTSGNASICACSSYQDFCNLEVNNACLGCGQTGLGPDAGGSGGGAPDGDADAGGTGAPAGDAGGAKAPAAASSGCGCSVVGGGGDAGLVACCLLIGIALVRRRAR